MASIYMYSSSLPTITFLYGKCSIDLTISALVVMKRNSKDLAFRKYRNSKVNLVNCQF